MAECASPPQYDQGMFWTFDMISRYTMVLILDGSSEYDTHGWSFNLQSRNATTFYSIQFVQFPCKTARKKKQISDL